MDKASDFGSEDCRFESCRDEDVEDLAADGQERAQRAAVMSGTTVWRMLKPCQSESFKSCFYFNDMGSSRTLSPGKGFLNRAIIKQKQEGKMKENGWSKIAAFSKTLACFYPESSDAICTASGDTLLCQETDKDPPKISGARGRQRSHLGRCFIETSKMAGLALEDGTRTLKTSTLGFVDQTQH
ncbi:hypothetical protein XENOCAPTIV_014616 [Xenoophorus captivus]|uniref:Uncharacterized protein n=1 Tax=Xenoophorus captivus TaxID=1517983 RepID=A0ABV0QWK2_9TELE